jgi:hypothetical protein
MAEGVRFELTIGHPTFVHRILPGKRTSRNDSKRMRMLHGRNARTIGLPGNGGTPGEITPCLGAPAGSV